MRSKIHSITSFYGTRVRAASGVGTALDCRFMVVMTAMHSVRSGQDGASGLCVAEVLINAVQLFTPTYLCVANVRVTTAEKLEVTSDRRIPTTSFSTVHPFSSPHTIFLPLFYLFSSHSPFSSPSYIAKLASLGSTINDTGNCKRWFRSVLFFSRNRLDPSVGHTMDVLSPFISVLCQAVTGWLGSRVVSVLDSGAEGPGFKSQSRRCRVTVLGKLFTPIVPLFIKQQN